MKKLIKSIYIILIIFFLPILVKAATILDASNQRPVIGNTFTVFINIDYGDDKLISSAHYLVEYDSEKLEFKNYSWSKEGKGKINSNTLGKIYIDKDSSTKAWDKGYFIKLVFTPKTEGKTTITIKETEKAKYDDGKNVNQTLTNVTVYGTKADEETKLKGLVIKDFNISPTFDPTITTYTLKVPSDTNEVEVIATPSNEKQQITGDGKNQLNYGDNKIKVVVKSQSGATETYEILITRPDNRSNDTSLKNLSVSGTDIAYEEGKDTYEATVSRSVDKVLISAYPTDEKATLSGPGEKELEIGLNTFLIILENSKGERKVYTINITRSTEELQVKEPSSKLLILKVNDIAIDLSKEKTRFLVGVNKDENSLKIDVLTRSDTAKYEISGNENLQIGINEIKIKVTETNDETTEYTLLAFKNPNQIVYVNKLSNLSSDISENILYNASEEESHIIEANSITKIKGDKLYYNVTNIYNGLIYRVIISKDINDQKLDLNFQKKENQMLTYQTSIPANQEIMLYVGDDFANGTEVKIYTYDKENEYTHLTSGALVINGYITFQTNGQQNYVFTTKTLIKEYSIGDEFIKNIRNKALLIIGLGILLLVISKLLSISIAKKKSKEPLY